MSYKKDWDITRSHLDCEFRKSNFQDDIICTDDNNRTMICEYQYCSLKDNTKEV